MAVPTYTTDLTTINLMTGSHVELTGALEGRITDNDPDNYIAGTNCATSQTRTGGNVSIAHPSNTVTIPAGAAVFSWTYHGAMPTVDTFVNDGMRICIGNSSANYKQYTIYGRDTLPKGGWFSSAVDPLSTADLTQGTPTTVTSTFGSRTFMTGSVSKGNPFAIDYTRYGRSIIVDDGEIANPGTFLGAATENDLVANKWGLFEVSPGGFSHKGLFQIGTVASLAYFVDSNKSIVIEDTIHCDASFTEYEILNAGSTVTWTGIQISALGTQTRGLFTVTDNATVTLDSCTFNDMLDFTFLSNTTVLDTVFRRCGQITLGGADITNSDITNSTAAISLSTTDLALVDNCNFISDGSNHAIELTSIGGGSMNWDNTLNGYVAGTTGSPAATGATGNEAIYVNVASGTLTINVVAGATTPSIRTAGASVNVLAGQVTTKLIVSDIDTTALVQNARVLIEATSGATGTGNYIESVSITRAGTVATVTHTAHALVTGNKVSIRGADDVEYSGVKTITVTDANTYTYTVAGTPISPATGTLTSTDVYISDITDVNGEVEDIRSFTEDQPISGRVRRATTGALYRTSKFNAIISSANGLTLNISLISDE
jgi:hypothetical protein